MSHEITFTNSIPELAFVGETPWHGLGQRLTEGASIEEWARAAGMQWVAQETPVRFALPDGTMSEFNERKVLYRSDTLAPLSVVGADYKPVQPIETLEFFRSLAAASGWQIHTAGTLQGGRKIWCMARRADATGLVIPGDRVKLNLLFATSLDGTSRTTVGKTAVRVVCANTFRLAMGRMADGTVRVSHRSQFDAEAVKQDMGLSESSFETFMESARRMAETPIAQNEARDILRELFGKPTRAQSEPVAVAKGAADGSEFSQLLARPVGAVVDEGRERRNVVSVMDLFNGAARGADHPGVAGTRWGLFNAVTEHIDHNAGRSRDSALTSAWFGAGDSVKQAAFTLLTK